MVGSSQDYVEKVVMKKALGTDTNSTSVRNQAAHALAKKGKLDGPSAVDKTIQKTRTKMEQQLEELKAQMEHIDRQTSKLRTIDNPDDALKFMESSGLKPEDIQRMVEKSGEAQRGRSTRSEATTKKKVYKILTFLC